jgi:putative ABC transport system permease protein
MTALHRKLLRDLWQLRGPAVAISLVVACGVATFVMSLCTLSTLESTRAAYYERYRFAEVFVRVKRAPEFLAARLAEIPGVRHVQTRIVQSVILDVPDLPEPATGQLVSLPDHGQPVLNGLYLQSGRWPAPRVPGEALVSDGFAKAHKLFPGDRVRAILNGRRQDLKIVGVALSPEFIYQIREGDILPDDRRFGIFWMCRSTLEDVFDMNGAFNDAVMSLGPDAVEPEVLRRIDLETDRFGGVGAYNREDQLSHRFISNEMSELSGMARVVPTIFLLVAGFLLQVVISRVVGTQREQIAMLKAFGYRRWEIGLHYLQLVLIVTLVGTALGIGVGIWLGRGISVFYARFFHFPELQFVLDRRVLASSVLISLGAACVATLGAVVRAVIRPPAEAMRPEPPAMFHAGWFERSGLARRLSPVIRMVQRQLLRRPLRAGMTCLGLSLAVSVLILGRFMADAIDHVMETEFGIAQRQDLTLLLTEPTNGRVTAEMTHLPGVRRVEPIRSVPTRMRAGSQSRRVGLMGLSPDAELFRIVDVRRHAIPLPLNGVILSGSLSRKLGLKIGDFVQVEVLEGRRPIVSLRIAGLVSDFQGESAYAPLEVVQQIMEEGDVVSGAFVSADIARTGALYRKLKETPRLTGVTLKKAALQSLRDTIAENLLRMQAFNVVFASIIAFGVVYNSARITLAERSRDLATLRVLGFTRQEVSAVLLIELGILTTIAIPLGLLLGYGLAAFVIDSSYDTQLFRIPLIINQSTYGFAALVTLIAAVISSLVVVRRVERLDMVAVLKSRE